MKSKQNNSKSASQSNLNLEDLRQEWYNRLRESGFQDIETPDGKLRNHGSLKDLQRLRYFSVDGVRIVSDYYSRASTFLEGHCFSSPTDRAIWSHHCNGLSLHKIAALLDTSYSFVYRTVARLKQEAGLAQVKATKHAKQSAS